MVVRRNLVLADTVNVSLSSGDGTKSITFSRAFTTTPVVVVSFAESLGAGKRGFVAATSISANGFTVTVDSDSALADIDVSYMVYEKKSSPEVE